MSKDTIYREDAIKAFVEETNGVNVEEAIKVVDAYLRIRECDEVWDSIRAIRDCLECAKDEIAEFIPSADRPQGKWIIHYRDKWMVRAECPKCHRRFEFSSRAIWKCCPMCETRMKGADDETTND